MNTPRGSLIPREVENPKELQLQVTPSELKFRDTLAGRVYRQPVTIYNLGRSNQKIRFLGPTKPQFKLILTSVDKEIASGLHTTAVVEYRPNKDEDIFDQLLIAIGNKAIEVPLIGLIPSCQLEIEPEVDFGTLVANSTVYCKEISIINRGKAPGKFTAEYQGQLPFVISPTDGIVEPKSSKIVKVDFYADQPRVVNEVAKVSLQGRPDILLNIKIHVVEEIIELLSMKNKKVECIHFGSTFFGTSKIKHALLYNNSPEAINWVAIIQNDSVGEELGANIQQRTDVAINNFAYLRKIKNIDVNTFISCVPNDGRLLPYEKTKLTFCFSPKLITGSKQDNDPLHRQDYAIFLRFDSVGSKDGFSRYDNTKTIKNDQFQKLELALRGSGLPVVLQFDLGTVLNFPPCSIGEHSEISFIMENRSKLLPVMFHFKKAANFRTEPERGQIGKGCTQKVTCSFIPHQFGVFKVKQFIEFIGPVADTNFQSVSLKPFHEIHLLFKSACKPSIKKVVMEINPGITPLITNPTGQFVVKDLAKYQENTPVAMLQSAIRTIHNHHLRRESVKGALIAFPNDRTASIRPGDQDKHFRTIFTKIPRHNYVDPEFANTYSEILEKKANEDYYARYIDYLKNVHLQKEESERERVYLNDDTDIGLQPASGLNSPPLSLSELEEDLSLEECELKPNQLLCTRNIEYKEAKALSTKVLKGLKSYPSTPHEIRDCSLILTPKQIHQVIVGPAVLNFGDVCVNSINPHQLHVVNMLPRHILIQLDINLKELQKTKKLSCVIPPLASTYMSIVFHSPTTGKFWKSFTYTVNNIPGGHLLVMAVVIPLRLELSSNELVLKPHGFLLKTCFRETVRLCNSQNYFVHFEWVPVNTRRRAFFICPSKGTIEPNSSLACEVTWQPWGFSSPEKGEFILHIDEGITMTLKCVAHRGNTKVLYLGRRLLFNDSPQGLTSLKKIVLYNVGQNHAYFKARSESLLPAISIIPSEGIIPFGGLTVLNIAYAPTMAEKFDMIAKVAIRHADDIVVRIGGSAEIADVEIKPNIFNFSGTFVDSTRIIPFVVKNKSITRVRVEFNLEGHQYFSMNFKDKSGKYTDPAFPGVYFLELEEKKSMKCGIVFSPKEVTTYEFTIQVRINFFESSKLYTEYQLSKSPMTPKTIPLIQPCYVLGTVSQAPLKLSRTEITFDIPAHTVNPNAKVTKTQDLVLLNFSKNAVEWTLDVSKTGKLLKDGIFSFSVLSGTLQPHKECNVSIKFCPNQRRKYTANIPVRLNNSLLCYRMLCLVGEIKSPKLLFDPPVIVFTPVPLDVTTVMPITILPQSYYRNATLNVVTPPARILGGDEEIHCLSVNFPQGTAIRGSLRGINTELTCRLSFNSSKPVSFFTNVLFCDNRGNRFSLPVIATAENCILTVYQHMAVHLDKEKVVLRNDSDSSPVKSRNNVLLPSEKDGLSSSAPSKCNNVDPVKGFFVGMEAIPEELNSGESETSLEEGDGWMEKGEENKQFFPEPGTKAYDFFERIINAAETWFSLFGWPEGPHSLSIPETIRRDVSKTQSLASMSLDQKDSNLNDFLRSTKTIFDMIHYLSGKMPDGINTSQSLPVDHTERVIQLHMQHSSVLNFLSARGACVLHILPEFLFEPEDYKKWIEIKTSTNALPACSSIPQEKYSIVIAMTEFEAWSKRAWIDLLLQIYKVLILSQVVPYPIDNAPQVNMQNSPKVNPHFVSSNIYSYSERILLSWMNTNYETARHVIWKNCQTGIPSERWILNFDKDLLDGLVFATLLGAYCPFLIEPHFINMYTQPKSYEQNFHNCLMIVNSFQEIGFVVGIQASDICNPNPILMLMLCVYMYERLPTYLPNQLVTFYCTLHDTVMRQILVKNPSSKNLAYKATMIGRDAADFSLSQTGNIVTIPAKKEVIVTLKFTSRFLHPAEASLLLIPKPKTVVGGTTMNFALKGEVHKFKPIKIIKCKSPCYKWKEITIQVKNPFHTAGDFRIILVESSTFISLTSQLKAPGQLVNYKSQGEAGTRSSTDIDEDYFSAPKVLKTSIRSSFIREFFCPSPTLHLGAKGTSSLELFFVPFNMDIRYCVVILSNRMIGELIYVVEGEGMIPLPSNLPTVTSSPSQTYDYRSSPGVFYEEHPVLYLNCKPKQLLDVDLIVPLTNEAKEKALAFAAQQQMSDVEYRRRWLTGTLESSSIRVAIALLGLTRVETSMLFNISKLKAPKSILYVTDVSLPGFFYVPKEIHIPQYPEILTKGLKLANEKVPDGSFPVSLQFAPCNSGRYPCTILLTSRYDVRLYYVEGVVSDERPEAKFDFETPAFKALTQDIPIVNNTKDDWKFQVTVEGEYFSGPSDLSVGAGETAQYSLTFKPVLECKIMGKLILKNKKDGMEHFIVIKGIGGRPVALGSIIANCKVGIPEDRTIMVPNYTKDIVTFKVSSDLPVLWGNPHITVQPGHVVPYILHISSWKRGIFKGKLSFSIKNSQDDDSEEDSGQDEDQNQIQDQNVVPVFWTSISDRCHQLKKEDADDDSNLPCQVWYHLEIHIHPEEPVHIIEMNCTALESITFEIPLRNVKEKILNIEVLFSNPALRGLKKFVLRPQECVDYSVYYTPSTTGYREESIIFQPEKILEFWYLLKFTVELPKPTTMPEMQCDLGKDIIQVISLANPTLETLELQVKNNNPDHFDVDVHKSPLVVSPRSFGQVPVRFCPSGLGRTGHQASIIFHCAQFKEWEFLLSGVGLFPEPREVERITSCLNELSSIVITFKNPTKEKVFINIILTCQEMPKNLNLGIHCDSFLIESSAFKINLNQVQGIELPPRGTIDIPVIYVPKVLKLRKTMVVVQMMRANGKKWPIDNFDELNTEMKRTMGVDSGEIQAIRWIYPIIGLPQAKYHKYPPAVIKCQAKKRIEKEVDLSLTGDFYRGKPILHLSDFVVTPKKRSYSSYEDVDDLPIKREFEYEIVYESEEARSDLQSSVAIYLLKRSFNFDAQMIKLEFRLIFSPTKPLRSTITLKIECITDGIWNYPITLIATLPDVDGVINIAASSLFKESVTDLWVSGRKRDPDPFIAYFLPGSDPVFFVNPQSGEIPPFDSNGIIFVVGFKPKMYGKKYRAKLAIQTKDMFYLYSVNGSVQVIAPSKNVKAKVDTTNTKFDNKPAIKHNFIMENTNIVRTGVSLTIKGAPLMLKK